MKVPVWQVTVALFVSFMLGTAAGIGACSYASRRTLASIAAAHESERADWRAELDLARGHLADAQRANRALAGFAIAEHKALVGQQQFDAAVNQQRQADLQAQNAAGVAAAQAAAPAPAPSAPDPASALLALAAKLLLRQ